MFQCCVSIVHWFHFTIKSTTKSQHVKIFEPTLTIEWNVWYCLWFISIFIKRLQNFTGELVWGLQFYYFPTLRTWCKCNIFKCKFKCHILSICHSLDAVISSSTQTDSSQHHHEVHITSNSIFLTETYFKSLKKDNALNSEKPLPTLFTQCLKTYTK